MFPSASLYFSNSGCPCSKISILSTLAKPALYPSFCLILSCCDDKLRLFLLLFLSLDSPSLPCSMLENLVDVFPTIWDIPVSNSRTRHPSLTAEEMSSDGHSPHARKVCASSVAMPMKPLLL